LKEVKNIINLWAQEGLKNIRFSGGEPTVYPYLKEVVAYAKALGTERVAVSTNGSAAPELYWELIKCGVNDFSISLDACCALMGKKMSGGIVGAWEKVVQNILELSRLTYVTVGAVLTSETVKDTRTIIEFAHNLGVADIRIVSAAQFNEMVEGLANIDEEILQSHPILRYRVRNYLSGRNIRGIRESDAHECGLVLDDIAIAGAFHFPCIIYLREGGNPIGQVGPEMRKERLRWFESHDSFKDDICRKNCLDVCIDYNNKFQEYHE